LLELPQADKLPERMSEQPQAPPLLGFGALIAVQFQGAFSDNALKWLLSFLVLEAGFSKERRDFWFVLVVPLLFAVPFLIFSIPGGYFADKYSKRSVTIWTKVFELGVMSFATFALAYNRLDLVAAALFLDSTQGAIFGPTKYGLLPELLPESRLSWGNGIIELTTLMSAILAALAGAYLTRVFHGRQVWSGLVFVGLAVLGLSLSFGIAQVPPADSTRRFDWNVPVDFIREIRTIGRDRILSAAVAANTFFWFLGSLLLLNIVLYATDVLHVDETHSSYLLAGLSLGIGVGSFVAGMVSGKKIEPGMVLPGLAGILVMAALLSRAQVNYTSALILLALLGFAGGFFVVPVNALIQQRPRHEEKGRTIAAANLLSFVGVALQPFAQFAMIRLGHPDPSRVFLIATVMTLAMGCILLRMLPDLWTMALGWTRLRPKTTL
jgi:acyl-[acyl-carrier-protein]-phospholipid O-acyltransferase/long-chain-fatty-acid--[acyl-carrier-protein] ligase